MSAFESFEVIEASMHTAGKYAECMKTLQIRNVPDDVHRQLKARAAAEGRSLSEFALSELRRTLQRPTWDQWFAMVEADGPVDDISSEMIVAIIREQRGE